LKDGSVIEKCYRDRKTFQKARKGMVRGLEAELVSGWREAVEFHTYISFHSLVHFFALSLIH
jgi:hypothetical protein